MDRIYFYNEDAYWDTVRRTLREVFEAEPAIADERVAMLREEVTSLPAEQRLAAYHIDPFRVAADLLGIEMVEERHIAAYQHLREGMRHEKPAASSAVG